MKRVKIPVILIAALSFMVSSARGQSTAFTYQGTLQVSGSPANGNYDLECKLYDAVSGGAQQGSTIQRLNVPVANGNFSVSLDFGAGVLNGADRFLDVAIRTAGGGAFTLLAPRDKVNSAPYAVRSLNAAAADSATNATTATNATQLGGVAAGQYVLTADPRMTDSRAPTAGSTNYIQNQNAGTQATSNFTISGNGFVNGSGGVGTTNDTFIGSPARFTVVQQTPGFWTQHIGTNNFAASNSFGLLVDAGTTSVDRALRIRSQSGALDLLSVRGDGFIGIGTDSATTHLHLKANAPQGFAIQMENTNTAKRLYIGNYGSTGAGNHWPGLDSANSSFLYSENNLVFTTPGGIHFSGSTTAEHMGILPNGNVGIGTTAPSSKFTLNSTTPNAFAATLQTTGVATGSSYGVVINAGTDVTDSALQINSQSGTAFMRVRGNGYVGVGTTNPQYRFHVVETALSTYAGFITGDLGLRVSGGHSALLATSVGTSLDVSAGTGVSVLGGLSTDTMSSGNATFNGSMTLTNLGSGGFPQVCFDNNTHLLLICGSSRNFKKNIDDFSRGLDLVRSLRPVTFDWKSDDRHDIGLIAEEVENVEPLLTTHLKNGQIQGVRYDLIGVVLINAMKEQQALIESQQKKNDGLKKQVDELRTVLCSIKSDADICKAKEK